MARGNQYRSPVAAKDPARQYQGAVNHAQGKRFEDYIEQSLAYCEQRGIGTVEKTPEPMRPTKRLDGGKFIAFYEKQAQPDYKGTLKGGRSVVFEAKHTTDERIDQNRVTQEQGSRLDKHASMGAECFVVVGFSMNDFFKVPWEVWRDMKNHFGRKYATIEELEQYRVATGKMGYLLILD
ncbi:MAG: Holliday junction resolvase RecU [Christensenellaceae bacterium]|jgi:recombination protein U|nr:Holliday junction resolvase RecU [Christensenellaceae bacterium]